MSSGGDELVTLALALLKRGASPGQVLEVMGDGATVERAPRGRRAFAEPAHTPAGRRIRLVKHAHVLAALRDAPGPLSAAQVRERLPALTPAASHRHLLRGKEIGSVVEFSKGPPILYTLTSAGKSRAGDPVHLEGGAIVVTGQLTHAAVLAAVGRGYTTNLKLRELFPKASRTAIYQHLTRGVDDGELTRTGKGQAVAYAPKGAKGTAAASAPKQPLAAPGTRLTEISNVLRKARKPLLSREICAHFPDMRAPTVEQHLLQAVKRGFIVRLGEHRPHTYTLKGAKEQPAAKKPRPEKKPLASPVRSGEFLATLRTAPGPLAVKEIYKLFPNMIRHSVDTALANGVKRGDVHRFGKEKPYTYRAKPEPSLPAAMNGSPTNGAPVATA